MNRLIIFLLLLVIATSSFSQSPGSTQETQAYLHKKSQDQKTAAWFLLGGGAVLSTVGIAISSNRVGNEIGAIFEGTHDSGFTGGEVIFCTGIVSMLGSIPLFISSSMNKRKAMAATAFIKIETRPFVQQGLLIKTSYPALGISIPIK